MNEVGLSLRVILYPILSFAFIRLAFFSGVEAPPVRRIGRSLLALHFGLQGVIVVIARLLDNVALARSLADIATTLVLLALFIALIRGWR